MSDPILNFLTGQVDLTKKSIVILETGSEYKVNDLRVRQVKDSWQVLNKQNAIMGQYKNKRLAVLSAALTIKKILVPRIIKCLRRSMQSVTSKEALNWQHW